MPFIFPEIVVRKVIDYGIKQLRANKPAFDDLFASFVQDELCADYGPEYREQIWQWFSTTKIPVIQAWSFNAQKIPCISIHLANETEDESKAALEDIAGVGENAVMGTGVFTVMVDIGIHTARGGDHVLWLYYIASYILFKHKLMAHRLGLKLHTFSASDYSKDADKVQNNVWTRWIRFRCTTENFWSAEPLVEFDGVVTYPSIRHDLPVDVSTSLDVDPTKVDMTANKGVIAERSTDNDTEYETLIDPNDVVIDESGEDTDF